MPQIGTDFNDSLIDSIDQVEEKPGQRKRICSKRKYMRPLGNNPRGEYFRRNARELMHLFGDVINIDISLDELYRCKNKKHQEYLVFERMLAAGYRCANDLQEFFRSIGLWKDLDEEMMHELLLLPIEVWTERYFTPEENRVQDAFFRFWYALVEYHYEVH